MACTICHSNKKRKLIAFYETSKEGKIKYSLFKCKKCGLIRPSPLPYTEETKNNVYNKPNRKKIEIDYESPEIKHYLKNFRQYLFCIKKYNITGSYLDIGCGCGALLYLAQSKGLKTEGIELNRELVEVLNKKGFVVYDKELSNEIYKNKKYDLITANHVIEHIEDLNSFVKNVYQLLDEGGYFIFAFPYIYGLIPKILRTGWYGQGYGTHLNFFSIKSIKQLLRSHHFKIIDTKITSMDYTKYNMSKILRDFISMVLKMLVSLGLGDNLFVVARK